MSYRAIMEYARLKKIALYPFTSEGYGKDAIETPYIHVNNHNKKKMFPIVHYSKVPLKSDKPVKNKDYFDTDSIERNDPVLVSVVLKLGESADGSCAKLKIVVIPDDVNWEIKDYDGMETIEEKHRSWC